jgi:hypothetical protein
MYTGRFFTKKTPKKSILLFLFLLCIFFSQKTEAQSTVSTFTIHTSLEGRTTGTKTIYLLIYRTGQTTPVSTLSETLTAQNDLVISGLSLSAGNYDFVLQSPGYIEKWISGVNLFNTAEYEMSSFLAGDLNNDGAINSIDWSVMSGQWNTDNIESDVNRDGVVNSIDFSFLNKNWNEITKVESMTSTTTPPPITPSVRARRTTPLSRISAGYSANTIPTVGDLTTCFPPGEDKQYAVFKPQSNCPQPNGWTPQDVVNIIKAYPDKYFNVMEIRHVGDRLAKFIGGQVNEAQRLGREQSVNTSKMMVQFRPDVYIKYKDGNFLCKPNCSWSAGMDGSKGETPFNTDWIIRVPTAVHNQVVQQFWNGKDPLTTATGWQQGTDDTAIKALNTPEKKVALYATVDNVRDNYFISGVVMDLRKKEYRDWSIKYLLYGLEDMGFSPGETVTIGVAYKPGKHTYYNGPANTSSSQDGSCYLSALADGTPINVWAGIAHVCANGVAEGPTIIHPTQYGPGEFETAMSSWFAEATQALQQAGYTDFNWVTIERPRYTTTYWSVLSDETLYNPYLIGELGGNILADTNTLSQKALVNDLESKTPTQKELYVYLFFFLSGVIAVGYLKYFSKKKTPF